MRVILPPLYQAQYWLKSSLALSIGLFGLLASSGNMLDYDSNWQFVHHVLSMDTMESWFSGQAIRTRAISDPQLQHLGYTLIIAGELVFGLLCTAGGLCMLTAALFDNRDGFAIGKTLFTLGCIPAVLVWYTGFAVIGGEYFAMWANQWNGQIKAYTFVLFIVASLIYVSQPEAQG